MMLDTGATNILSHEVAKALNLPLEKNVPVGGGGENIIYGSYCQVDKLEVASQVMPRSRFLCMDVRDMHQGIGFPYLDGLIGYEVFAQFLTEVNFDRMEISLKSFSERQTLQNGEQVVPFGWYGTTPLVQGRIDGIAANFWLDTGDRASATLALPFIGQYKLMDRYQPGFSMMTGYGLGGPLKTAMVFAENFQLGELSFSKTLLRLPTSKSRALSLSGVAGTIGMGLLRQFNLVFDYSRQEMVLSPNNAFEQDRSFDRSGMWISPLDSGEFEIRDVLQGSPAWDAGLRVGHVVIAVDGVSSAQTSVLEVREILKDPSRSYVRLSVRVGSEVKVVRVLLRDLI